MLNTCNSKTNNATAEKRYVELPLTIFTPTFNRVHTLPALYNSLCKQKFLNFIWLVIDDGSKDDTAIYIKNIQQKSPFKIEYYSQKNSGKHIAWNKALSLSHTEFFMCIDSDDELLPTCLESLFCLENEYLNIISRLPHVVGIRMNAVSSKTGSLCSAYLSKKPVIKSWFYEVSFERFVGEKLDVFKLEILKKYPFPKDKNIKFVPESYMYSSVSHGGYFFLYLPIATRLFNDKGNDGSRLSLISIKKHSLGHYIYRSHLIKVMKKTVWFKNPIYFLKTLIRFSQTALLEKKDFRSRLHDSHSIFATFISYILQYI